MRQQLHDDPVLVGRRIDRRHLALAKGVVERVLDLHRRDAELASRLAVDGDGDLRVLDQQIARDIGQGRLLAKPRLQFPRGRVERVDVAALQGVLVETLRGQSADRDRRRILDEDRDVGHALKGLRQIARDVIGAAPALVDRLQVDRELSLIRRGCRADRGRDRAHIGIARHDRGNIALVLDERVEEALRRRPEEPRRRNENPEREHERRRPPRHHPCEAALIDAQRSLVEALRRLVHAAMLASVLRPQKAAREHRRQRQRHEPGYENRHADRHSKFMKQLADDTAHEQKRYEDGGQRQSH